MLIIKFRIGKENNLKKGDRFMKRIMVMAVVVIAVSLSFLSSGVFAATEAGKISLSPHIGGYIFQNQQNINSDPTLGIGIGYGLTDRFGIEGTVDHIHTATKGSTESNADVYLYRLDGLFHFNLADDVKPYIAAGVGFINTDISPSDVNVNESIDNTDFMANAGLGIKIFITDSFLARGDFRLVGNLDDSKSNMLYTVGISYLFGGKKAEPAPYVAPAPQAPADTDGDGVIDSLDKCLGTPAGVSVDTNGCPLDNDGDGVYDYLDKCPGTPKGAAVDMNGCPLDSDGDLVYDYKDKCPNTPKGSAVDVNGCSLDSDADGVLDINDKCPNTPAGVAVDTNGCPLDSDGDGVADYLDKCPGTLSGIQVDAAGCPVAITEKVSIELSVEFEFNSAEVKNVYGEHIKKVANFLATYPNVNAVIEGHTDGVGSDAYNMKLSQKRAENVMKYLAGHGIAPERLKAEGFGESRPIADNNTDEGRQKNRRVVAVISTVVTK